MKNKVLEAYTYLFYILVSLSLGGAALFKLTSVSIRLIKNNDSIVGILTGIVIALATLTIAVTNFLGPTRASYGEIFWTENKANKKFQWFQPYFVAGICALIFAVIGFSVWMKTGLPVTLLVGMIVSLILLEFLGIKYVSKNQFLGRSDRSSRAVSIMGGIVLLIVTLTTIGVSAAFLITLTASLVFFISLFLVRGFSSDSKPGDLVPRWELIRADTNVSYAELSFVDMNMSHLRERFDHNDKRKHRKIKIPPLPKPLTLYLLLTLRWLRNEWKYAFSIVLLAIDFSHLFESQIGFLFTAAGAIYFALKLSEVWISWREDVLTRRMFTASISTAPICIIAFILTGPAFLTVAETLSATLSCSTALYLVWVNSCATIITVLGRNHAAEKRKKQGLMGLTVLTPDMGVLPLGIIRTLLSGWFVAFLLACQATFYRGYQSILLISLFTLLSILRELFNNRPKNKCLYA